MCLVPTSTTGDFATAPGTLGSAETIGGAALLCTGAGAYSVDARLRHREGWLAPIVAAALVIAVAAAILTWVVLNGSDPIHLTIPRG